MTTVWIYVDTSKEVGDVDHLKVFVTSELADAWFKENDPEGVGFEYEVIEEWSPAAMVWSSRRARTDHILFDALIVIEP